jgi:L-ribulose-5-phosphate 3-epimerase
LRPCPARGATVAAFSGPRFAERFDALLGAIQATGVSRVEVWSAHVVPEATEEMIAQAQACLAARKLSVVAYAASLRRPGLVEADLDRVFAVATALGAPIISGGLHDAYAATVLGLCRRYGIRFAIENHPEHSPRQVLAQLDGNEEWFGTALDTGWYRTHGADVLQAIDALGEHIIHVHLKDICRVGLPHRTCPLGEGIVGVPAVLTRLADLNYCGAFSIEHEPPDHDPTADLARSVARVRAWQGILVSPPAPAGALGR